MSPGMGSWSKPMEESIPKHVPLTGGDYFLLALDHQMRKAGLDGSICRLVLELDGPLETGRLHSAVGAGPLAARMAGARMCLRFPFALPRWRIADKRTVLPVNEHTASGTETLESPFPPGAAEPALRPARPPGLALGVVSGPAGPTRVILSWHHALMDAQGSELLMEHLDRGSAPEGPSTADRLLGGGDLSKPRMLRGWRHLPDRLRFARRSLFLVDETGSPPIASLVDPNCVPESAENCLQLIEFTEDETRRIDEAADRAGTGLCRSLFGLAASMRAVRRVCIHRGQDPGALVVPVPQNRRRCGAAGPTLSNHVTFLFYRLEPDELDVMPRAVESLKRQMISQMRDRLPESFAVAMDLFRRMPLWAYSRMLRGPTRGHMASLFFSDTGENFPDMETFLGCRISRIAHLAPVSASPGVGVVVGRFRHRSYVVVSWVEGCLTAREQEIMTESIREDLLTGGMQ